MNVVIIDDEPKARKLLEILIRENCSKITSIFTAEDLISGVDIIKREKPQIVFLDIEMPEHSGLEIFDFIDSASSNFEIIFTTAYSEYAIKAFELSAVDYLLKPLRVDKLVDAIEKAIANIGKSHINLKLEELQKSLKSSNFKKIALPIEGGIKFVNFEDVILFKADGMYTSVHIQNASELLISKPLKHFEELLEAIPTFYRPHRSYLINLKYIHEYSKRDGGYIVMDNGETVSVSKDKKEEFLTIVQHIG
ncbi:LytR/AlgR family response regulator transcription factor [Winogradskyella sp. SM1960]|uniref:LytR/AlgR family response regulator transcription factor n=1 Tax=Winogradskyella sp. SM1960 TaxID=2865955 RepID=UPI001CD6C58B|nr:LytTR family DNA-binding domain-containing protein [Winogradskyella sp. SM1960]